MPIKAGLCLCAHILSSQFCATDKNSECQDPGQVRNHLQYLPVRGYCFLTDLIDGHSITHFELVVSHKQLVRGQGGLGGRAEGRGV